MKTMASRFGVFVVCLSLAACANLRKATRQDQETIGTRDYRADHGKVVKALKAALLTIGYEITFEDPDTGVIKTGKRLDKTMVTGSGYSASATHISNALTLHIDSRDSVQRVVAVPRAYVDMTEHPLEELNVGYARDIWTQVFKELDDNLGAPGVSPTLEASTQ